MLRAFGPAELRKHLLVMHFLNATFGLVITEQDKTEFADQERIAAKISESIRQPWGRVVEDYAAALAQSGVTVRTQRMYISVAVEFCKNVGFRKNTPWIEEDARRFMKKKPGIRANLTRFISFCRQTYGWDVAVLPSNPSKKTSKPLRTVNELKKLLQEMKATGIENARTETLAKIIAKSFGLRIRTIMSILPAQLLEKAGRLVLNINGELIDIPEQLEEISRSYAARLVMSASE